MRVIMTGGVTGGHIYPAVAIADQIKYKDQYAEILFIGTERGLEKTIVPDSGYAIRFITATGFNRKQLLKNFKVLKDLRKGTKEAEAIIREFDPDIVVGTGGYVCAPVIMAADKLGIRAFVHEQNVSPGLTNRLLEKHVEKVFIGFPEAAENFKMREKVVFSGNPIRKEFFCVDGNAAREKLGFSKDDFIMLIFGGSQGASRINEAAMETLSVLSGIDKLSVVFITGKDHYNGMLDKIKEMNKNMADNIRVLPYANDMALYLSACDLVISRAGALTVSEITVCGKPSILIPSPNVTGNHQYFNAKAVADRGGAILIEEKDLDAETLIKTIMKIKNDEYMWDKMAKSGKSGARINAVEIIYDYLTAKR